MANSEFGRLLLACTREHDWDQPPDGLARSLPLANSLSFVDHACLHGVEACVHLSLRSVDAIPQETRDQLEQAYFVALRSHACALHDLAIAAEALERARVPWLTFKGPVLAEHVYGRADLRAYGDLDLLVSPSRLRDAVRALEAAGGKLLDRNWHLALRHMRGQIHVLLPAGTIVDLHWHLLNDPEVRTAFPADVHDVLDRARTVEIRGDAIRTLAAEDTLVHLALHACTSGGNRLIGCKDLEQAVRRGPVDWPAVVTRAHEWHAGQATAVMLIVASRALRFEVADETIRALSPGPVWRRLARVADRLAPVEAWDGGGSLARDVCRSTRRDDWASTYALARRFASFVKAGRRTGPHEVDRDPTSPGSLLFAGSDERDRAAYFAAVERSTPSGA
jgi:hypothetical protein